MVMQDEVVLYGHVLRLETNQIEASANIRHKMNGQLLGRSGKGIDMYGLGILGGRVVRIDCGTTGEVLQCF